MPLINLIQEQRLQNQREESRTRLFFLTFVASACAGLGAFGFTLYQKESAASELARLQALNQKIAPLQKQIEDNQRAFGAMSPRVKTLEDAQAFTAKWDRILNHLLVQMPDSTWLTGIRCQAPDPTKPIEVGFLGMSADQQRVGEFILRLQNCPDLESVNLKQTVEKQVNEGNGIEFEVTGNVVGSATAKPKDESKEEEGQK
jgi:Tfp pilus assembly protein PilN